jgi:hypothetical protein
MNPLVKLELLHDLLSGSIEQKTAQNNSLIDSITGDAADGIRQLQIDKLDGELRILEQASAVLPFKPGLNLIANHTVPAMKPSC